MEFVFFDPKTISKEFRDLPPEDLARLSAAMQKYVEGNEIGWTIKDYGDGLKMITDSGRGQGRCLFFEDVEGDLVIVKVYKKESQLVPQAVLNSARARME